jgi:hypothetical protein
MEWFPYQPKSLQFLHETTAIFCPIEETIVVYTAAMPIDPAMLSWRDRECVYLAYACCLFVNNLENIAHKVI